MRMNTSKRIQIIALLLSLMTVHLCLTASFKPKLLGITNPGNTPVLPITSLIVSASFLLIDIFYLVLLNRIQTPRSAKSVVIATTLLFCLLTVIVEPSIYFYESRQIQLQMLQIENAAEGIFLASIKQGIREVVRNILFISSAFSFLSMGGIWDKYTHIVE